LVNTDAGDAEANAKAKVKVKARMKLPDLLLLLQKTVTRVREIEGAKI
jgi:hypothetical protein